MNLLLAITFLLVGLAGAGVVFTREPLNQAVALGLYGILLGLLFLLLQAPDVALSQIVVATVATPLMILFALAKIRGGVE